ncbi:hypothetical protein MUK70_12785 [Dyadobacter chenwenxiniae]|uniref:Uncharacterized protein n=1 Tax=Dyadobacter chenwenxiniae TaxID=2906456 RepID=A0A9X1PHQ7_9BACT|nr:hypothetical protein [Dyadobacter chenwenxiniae]MCF0060119.1 hypothetical protein [Dyadobacter chenwenxiniae]UON85857.1 hypothetical protein MUK70_12785 [Dyadobacter chenwenxiniae]
MEDLKNFSETKVKLKLGDNEYLVNFGIFTRRRIEEQKPGFTLFQNDMPDFEMLPFLIQNGIEPEDRKWDNEKEFIGLFEDCADIESLNKIPLAFQNSVGFTNQAFIPLLERVSAMMPKADQSKNPKTR